MSNKHTPGPWEVLQEESDKDYLRIRGSRLGERYKIANVHDRQFKYVNEFVRQLDHAESIANARLIAAAPELLESHEPEREGPDFLDWIADRLVNVYGENENADFVVCLRRRANKARAAIAKATGGTA